MNSRDYHIYYFVFKLWDFQNIPDDSKLIFKRASITTSFITEKNRTIILSTENRFRQVTSKEVMHALSQYPKLNSHHSHFSTLSSAHFKYELIHEASLAIHVRAAQGGVNLADLPQGFTGIVPWCILFISNDSHTLFICRSILYISIL